MNAITELKQGLNEGWKSITEGWNNLRDRAGSAMTRYRREPVPRSETGTDDEVDPFRLTAPGWGLLAGEVFETRDKVVVRLEAPGMDAKDFELQVDGDLLRVRGEKRSSRESGDGRYRMLECAYGTFERSIRLPTEVVADKASAAYRKGVLRIELPKSRSAEPRQVRVKVR